MYGCRRVAFVGSVVGAMGIMFSSFATTLYQLYITFGIMTGKCRNNNNNQKQTNKQTTNNQTTFIPQQQISFHASADLCKLSKLVL